MWLSRWDHLYLLLGKRVIALGALCSISKKLGTSTLPGDACQEQEWMLVEGQRGKNGTPLCNLFQASMAFFSAERTTFKVRIRLA